MALPATKEAKRFYRAAYQRLDDAHFLMEAGRTTGTVYLAGYSVECIIKALILSVVVESKHAGVLAQFRGARAHDYEWLLRFYRDQGGQPWPGNLASEYSRVNTWTTDMRYAPGAVKEKDARMFLASTLKLIEWADGRL